MPSPLCKCWRVVVKGDAHPPYEIIVEERGGRPHSGGFGALDCLPPTPPHVGGVGAPPSGGFGVKGAPPGGGMGYRSASPYKNSDVGAPPAGGMG